MEFLQLLTILLGIALTIFWMYMAIQAVKALRQIGSTLRRIAASQEILDQQVGGKQEKRF
jgi:hypothetical protein